MKSGTAEVEVLASNLVEVIVGPIKKELNIVGMTVGSARRALREPLTIPDEANPVVNGRIVGPATRLERGDRLEFVLAAGVKG